MKSAPFRYVAPESLDAALDALTQSEDSRVIAGGQSLVPLMAFRLARPDLLVDLKNVVSLRSVTMVTDGVEVGAMVSQTTLAAHPGVHPLLPEAIAFIAHDQIRNRGTVGGSLAHADPAAELPAVAVALGAQLRAVGPRGRRWIPAAEFFLSYFTTALEPEEILTAVQFPRPVGGEGWAIEEVARRRGDFALVGIVARLIVREGLIEQATVVPFAVGDRPVASPGAAEVLVDNDLSAESFSAAARRTAAEVEPPSDVHASASYRRRAVAVLVRRALATAARRSQGGTNRE